MQWREDIFQAKSNFEKILEDEILALIRRVETDGWIIMGTASTTHNDQQFPRHERLRAVETMTRFIYENGHTEITAAQVA